MTVPHSKTDSKFKEYLPGEREREREREIEREREKERERDISFTL